MKGNKMVFEEKVTILLIVNCIALDLHNSAAEAGPSNLEPRYVSHEQRLMRTMVKNYDNSVRPVYDALSAVDVKLGLALTQILDIDEKNQVLTTNVWLEAEWFDERLNWSASDYGGLYSIRIPSDKLWLPDIVLYNSVDDYTSGYMPTLVMVYNTSRVFWGPVIRFRSSCKIDITFFPFDTQVCKLKLGSWAYTGLEVNVWNSSHTMDLSNFVDNGEWELLGVAVERNIVFYSCCKEPFPDVTFSIQLRRRTKYYFMNIIIPCIILSFLCLGGFLLPPESGEKITLGLSVLLTITVFMLMVADKMPQTSESISVISIYLMSVLATSCMSVLSSVLILSIHHQRSRPNRAPLWLRKFCFGFIAPLLRLSRKHDAVQSGEITTPASSRKLRPIIRKEAIFKKGSKVGISDKDESECMRMNYAEESTDCDVHSDMDNHICQQVYMPNNHVFNTFKGRYVAMNPGANCTLNQRPIDRSTYQNRALLEEFDTNLTESTFNEFPNLEDDGGEIGKLPENRIFAEDGERSGSKSGQVYSLMVTYLVNLIQTFRQVELQDMEIFKEWHDVAYVLDRLLFCLFFVITVVSTVCILEMRPPTQTI